MDRNKMNDSLVVYRKMMQEEHNKKQEQFRLDINQLEQHCREIEWMMHGAGRRFSDEMVLDEEQMKEFTEELTSIVETNYRNENKPADMNDSLFIRSFFRMSLSFLYLVCSEEDLNFTSFIKIAEILDKGKENSQVSTFEIMVKRNREELKPVFFEDYDVMMKLHEKCYKETFSEDVKKAIYRYLDTHGFTYENPNLQSYILKVMKNACISIRDFSSLADEEERNRELNE